VWLSAGIAKPDPHHDRIRAVAAGGNGRVVALSSGYDPIIEVSVIAEGRDPVPLFRGAPGYFGRQLLAAQSGMIHVLADNAEKTQSAIITIRPDGTLANIRTFAERVYAFDLAADQCTLFLVTAGMIKRYDICTGLELAVFASIDGPLNHPHIVVLPDGGVLLQNFGLHWYEANGTITRTHTIGARSLSLASGGSRILVAIGCTEELQELDFNSLAVLRTYRYTYATIDISHVSHEAWTAALGPSITSTNVPALSPLMLGALIGTLAVGAYWRMR
jgi:hypothetical protein